MRKDLYKLPLVLQFAVAGVALSQSDVTPRPAGDQVRPADRTVTEGTGQQGTTAGGAIDTGHKSSLTRDAKEAPGTVRTSQLIGTEVYNRQNKHLGEIKDVVLDKNDRKVGYVVVSYGGLAGMGDKYFALPYKMIQYSGADTRSKAYVDLDEQTLRNAPGFDRNQWPTEANADYYQKLDQYYAGQARTGTAARDAMKDMDQQAKDTMHDTSDAMKNNAKATGNQPIPAGAQMDRTGLQWTRRGSSLIGANVESPDGTNLGEVKDIVLDWNTGDVKYAVLSYGGILGLGDKLFAVPIDAFKIQSNNNKLVLPVSKDQLKNAPGFNKDQWPNMADPSWNKDVNSFYQSQGQTGDMNR